jgi:ADP-heptose:LPS heptosyltransferase
MTNPAHPGSGPIVISRPDRIGDVIISTACLAPVREKFPDAKIYFLASEQLRPLIENHPLITGFVSLSSNLTSELRRIRASAIVHLHPDAECYRAASNAGIPIRIGYSKGGQNHHLSHAITDRRAEGLQHEAEYCFDLLQEIGIKKPACLRPSIHLADADKQSLQQKLPWELSATRFVVLNASAYSAKKEWPNERFAAVANKMKDEFGFSAVFVGTKSHLAHDHFDLSGQTTLAELCWLLKYASALVTNDTGTSHLAAAVDCPGVVIFGRTHPQYGPTRWRPLSDRATIVTSPASRKRFEATRSYWRRSFAAIAVETVIESLREILRRDEGIAPADISTRKVTEVV